MENIIKQWTNTFPFSKVEKGSSIILYGAGQIGGLYLQQVQHEDYCKVLYIADKNHNVIKNLHGIEVVAPESILVNINYDYVVVSSIWFADQIVSELKAMGIPDSKIVCDFKTGSHLCAAYGEDLVVYTIFKLLGKERFNYIDVGANDPYNGSNTAYLYFNGCRGIDIEANPDLFDALKKERPEDVVLNVGIGISPGTLPFYMFDVNTYNTFKQELVAVREAHGRTLVEVKMIPVFTLGEIIKQYANDVWPDYLKIDIEGWDYDVLDSCDFSHSAPTVICTEVHDSNINEVNAMLDAKGYTPFHRTASNVIYIRTDVIKHISTVIS